MKKFIIVLMALVMLFGFVSCEANKMDDNNGLIDFKVNYGTSVAKALTVSDTDYTLIDHIELRFTPVTSTNVNVAVGTSNDWEKGYIKLDSSKKTGSWDESKHKYLSQGQWLIEARAVNADSSKIYYYGAVTTFVNRGYTSTNIVMTPNSSTATGTLAIGYTSYTDSTTNTASPITSRGLFSVADSAKQVLVYTIYDYNGNAVSTATNDVLASNLENLTSSTDTIAKYSSSTETLKTGSYYISMRIAEYKGSATTIPDYAANDTNWVLDGGEAKSFGIYDSQNTYLTGSIDPSNYIDGKVTTSISENGNVAIAWYGSTPTISSGSVTLKAKLSTGSESVDKWVWFLDGDRSSSWSSDTQEHTFTSVPFGKHIFTCVGVNTTLKSCSPAISVTIEYLP